MIEKSPAAGSGFKPIRPWVPCLLGIIVLVSHLLASFTYSNWLWGFNHYFFLPRPWTYTLIAAGCILCLPLVVSRICRLLDRIPAPRVENRLRLWLVDLGVAGLLGLVFWLFRTPRHFLGDGRLLIRLLDQDMWFHPHEPLDRMIHYGVLLLTRPVLGWDARTVYAAVSVGAGVIYTVAALRLGAILRQKTFAALSLLTLGSVVLFFGYAESYSLATAVVIVYMLLALEHLDQKRRLIWAASTLLIGVALHHAMLSLVPSFLYLFWSRQDKVTYGSFTRYLNVLLLVAVFLVPLGVTLRHWETGGVSVVVVPFRDNPLVQYTVFSWRHLVDFLNEQILISPLGWIVAGMFAVTFFRNRLLGRSRRFTFLFVVAVFPLLLSMILRPGLGGSQDWDLWSMGSVPYVVAAVCWIAGTMSEGKHMRYLACVVVIVGLIHVFPWIVVNQSEAMSTDHFSRMLKDNPLWTSKRIGAAQAELAHFYVERGDFEKAVKHLEGAVVAAPKKAAYWSELGTAYYMLGKPEEAASKILRAIELDPGDAAAYITLGQLHLERGRLGEAETAFRRAAELNPGLVVPHFNLGQIYELRGETDKAVDAYKRAVEARPAAAMYWWKLAEMLERAPGRRREALDAWKRVAGLSRRDPSLKSLLDTAQQRVETLQQSHDP